MRHKRPYLFPLVSLALLFCVSGNSYGQAWSGIINPTRATNWSAAGIPGGIPSRTTACSTINASSYGNGSSDATSGIQSALNSCASNDFVSLSAGTFLINGNLTIPSNVTLRGQGANQTILQANGSGNSVIAEGSTGSPNVGSSSAIVSGATQGSTQIVLSGTSGVSVGSYLMITELNDPSFVSIAGSEGSCTWCDGGLGWNGTRVAGQIVEVTSVSGTSVGIKPSLYMNYPLTPLATPFSAATKFAGVENLQIYANKSTGYNTNFAIGMCAYCWLSGVEGNYTDGDHVEVDYSFAGEIVNSYFSNAYLHTPGTYDSDVVLRNKSSQMLVQNNILERLHVGLMLEWGPSGNVIAYNYMLGNFDGGGSGLLFPGTNTHGAHPMYNLFEGNDDPHAHLDSIWGSNSDNTFFRNWELGTTMIGCTPLSGRSTVSCSSGYYAVQGARAVDLDFLSSSENLVGDVIGSAQQEGMGKALVPMLIAVCGLAPCGSGSRGYDTQAVGYSLGYGESSDTGSSGYDSLVPYSTIFMHGEYSNLNGTTTWAPGVTQTLPASFYLSGEPSWWPSAVPWPPVGPDVTGGPGPAGHAYNNAAKYCYESVMGGANGQSSPLSFNASTCYGQQTSQTQPPGAPAPPTNLAAVPH